jgi:hypothetical protein
MNRTLQDGTEAPGFDIAVRLKVVTKCPSKWKLIDMETGEEYVGQIPSEKDTHHWKKTK